MKLIIKQYKKSVVDLNKHLSPDYKADPKYRFYNGNHMETHLYENIPAGEFYDKLELVLESQNKAHKVNIALGYSLISITDESDIRYWYPNVANTMVFDSPITVNTKGDIRKKVITPIRSMELANKLPYPSSGFKLLGIIGFKLFIYFRNHALGDSQAVIPKSILDNKHVINFPKTNNKCVFHCIAFHSNRGKDPRKIQALVKDTFKRYCSFKGVIYTLSLFRNFKPIDILQFDELEECFQLSINVYTKNIDTGSVGCIRPSEKAYDRINILSCENHALYIKNIDMFQNKYQCQKCDMIFKASDKLRNHAKNRCDEVNIESFPEKPTMYIPPENTIKKMLQRYSIKNLDHYIDHFIVYDFEAILKPTVITHGDSTTYDNEHIPVSVSITDSLTKRVECFISDEPNALLKMMFDYIKIATKAIQRYNVSKYLTLLRTILKREEEKGTLESIDELISQGEYKSFFDVHGHINNFDIRKNGSYNKIKRIIDQVPVLGYNSGKYDINLIKKDLFSVIGTDNIKSVIRNPSYMCIATDDFKMLDIMNYVPMGTSLDSYLTTYLGGCKCDDKVRCTCGMAKGIFPYEYITSFQVLNETKLPPKEAFNSKLRGTVATSKEYARVQFVWDHYGMKSIKDLLIWYNNLDVVPFVEAIKSQRELFKRFDLDMLTDGVSLPGLSEKVMYQTCYNNLKKQPKTAAPGFGFLEKRMKGYRVQDAEAKREYGMTIGHLNTLLDQQKYLCALCYCPLSAETASADRINNSKGHINGNIMISCIECNVARKDMSIAGFRKKKLLDFNANELVYSIDREEKEIYSKMKSNIAGGPSIIFNRYAKRNETKIRGEKTVKKVIGYDANALYLWALGNDMPCGRLTTIDAYEGIVDDIISDKIFGFLECDIRTPNNLKEYFSEMTPIFKNIEIDCSDEKIIGSHMYEYNQTRGKNGAKPARKLIGSYFGEKILIYAPLLKWYLSHGMEITNTYSFIKASAHKAFKPFMEEVSQARRDGNADESKKMVGTMMKLVGNSAFGRSGMDMSKHKQVKYESDEVAIEKKVEHFTFHSMEELNGSCEITMKKRRIKSKNPIHLSIAIYQLAKLRMLQFYYDCIDFYFDRSDFQYQEMDTDSAYIAFSCDDPFSDCIKPNLQAHFTQHKFEWFPRDYNKEVATYDTFTPGLFKEEWRGDAIVALSSKNYICYIPDEEHKVKKDEKLVNGKIEYFKLSAKGIQKNKNSDLLSPENFESVVRERITLKGTNKGFRISKETKSIITYSQTKTALNYYYDKRQVLSDGISTILLDI